MVLLVLLACVVLVHHLGCLQAWQGPECCHPECCHQGLGLHRVAALALLGLGRRPDFLLGCDMQEDPEDPEDPREGGQLVCRRRRRGLAAGVCRLGSECQGSRARRLLARFRHRASRMRSSKQPRAKATRPHLLCHRRINGSTRQPPAVHVQASLTGAKLARVLQPPPAAAAKKDCCRVYDQCRTAGQGQGRRAEEVYAVFVANQAARCAGEGKAEAGCYAAEIESKPCSPTARKQAKQR